MDANDPGNYCESCTSEMKALEKTERFHSLRRKIPGMIYDNVKGSDTIYGARALNKQLPHYLRVPTTDYDVFSTTPKADARAVERALDKKAGFDAFGVYPAQHKGTWKVKDKLRGETFADYTPKPKNLPHREIQGKRYVPLTWIEKRSGQILKDPEYEWRHKREQDVINRIKLYKEHTRE